MTEHLPNTMSRLDYYFLAICIIVVIDSCASQPSIATVKGPNLEVVAPLYSFHLEDDLLAIQ